MADSASRQRAIEAAKERARQRVLEAQQAESQARAKSATTADQGTSRAELNANEQLAAQQRLAEAGRMPGVGNAIEGPGTDRTVDTPRGQAGTDLEARMQSNWPSPADSQSPEASRAVDTFFAVTRGEAPVGSASPLGGSSPNPWVSSGAGGYDGSGRTPGREGISQETGGGGYGMNEYFTRKAMELAAKGDIEGLDRLAAQAQEHYGKAPVPPTESGPREKGVVETYITEPAEKLAGATPAAQTARAVEQELAELGQGGGEVGKKAAAEQHAEAASEVGDSGSVVGAVARAVGASGDKKNAHQPAPDDDGLSYEEKQAVAEMARRLGGGVTAGYARRIGNIDFGETPVGEPKGTGEAPDQRDKLTGTGGDSRVEDRRPDGAVSEAAFDVEHSQDDVINYGEKGGGGATGTGRYTSTPDTEREQGPISVNIPGSDSESSDPLRQFASATNRLSDSSRQAAEIRFTTAGEESRRQQQGGTQYTTQQVNDGLSDEERRVSLGGDSSTGNGGDPGARSAARELSPSQEEMVSDLAKLTGSRAAFEDPRNRVTAPEIRGADTPGDVPQQGSTGLTGDRPGVFDSTRSALDGTSAEASAALDAFNAMRDGGRPTLESPDTNLARPGMGGSDGGGGGPASGIMDGPGRTAGMNQYFTEKAMEYAEKGDSEGLDRLIRRVHDNYGKEAAPETRVVKTGEQVPETHANAPQFDLVSGNPALGNAVYTDASGELFDSIPAGSVVRVTTLLEGEVRAAAQLFAGKAGEEVKTGSNAAPKDPGPDGEGGSMEQRIAFSEYLRRATGYDGGYRGAGDVDPSRYDSGEGASGKADTSNALKGDTGAAGQSGPSGNVSTDDLDFAGQQGDVIYSDATPDVGPMDDVPTDIAPDDTSLLDPFRDAGDDHSGMALRRPLSGSLTSLAGGDEASDSRASLTRRTFLDEADDDVGD